MNIHKESITIQVKKWIDDLLCSLSQPIYASEWREEYYKIISHLKQNEIKTFTLYQLGYNAFICESFGKFKKDFDQSFAEITGLANFDFMKSANYNILMLMWQP